MAFPERLPCYESGANSYIQKPLDLDKFMQAIQALKNYWFEIALFPKAKKDD